MVFGIFKPTNNRVSTARNAEDADVLYFGAKDTNTREEIIESLSEKDLDTKVISQEDLKITEESFSREIEFDEQDSISSEKIEKELESDYLDYRETDFEVDEESNKITLEGKGVKAEIEGQSIDEIGEKEVIWRPKRFLDDWETVDDVLNYGLLKENADNLNFNYEPLNTPTINDKEETKQVLRENGLPVPETYNSVEEVNSNEVVAKSKGKSHGAGFEHIKEEDEVESLDEDKIYEEFLDHYGEGSVDRRMFLVGNKIVKVGDRNGQSDEIEAKNINNGGFYSEPDNISSMELDAAEEIVDIFGEGIYALDYVRHEDGTLDIMELNDTPGTKINSLDSGADVFDEIAKYIDDPEEYKDKGVVAEELESYIEDKTEEVLEDTADQIQAGESLNVTDRQYAV